VTLLREAMAIQSPDDRVMARARESSAILLSLNGDFADIVTYRQRTTWASLPSNCTTTRK
jgi:predicted nuclease of predicted toxin-antitoxin system